jgi:hypothetical protein
MDVNHPNLVVSSVEVLDSLGGIELVPTSTNWVLGGVTDSSASVLIFESEDLSILTDGDGRPGSVVNKGWLEITLWSGEILGIGLVIEFSISSSHPDLSVSTASDFSSSHRGWSLSLPSSSSKLLVKGGGDDSGSEEDFTVRSDSPNVSGSTDSDVSTFLSNIFDDPFQSFDLVIGNTLSVDDLVAGSTAPDPTVTSDIEVSHLFSSVVNWDPKNGSWFRSDWLLSWLGWVSGVEPK